MSSNLWRGKRVLVTGADGFVGSHLVEALLERDARVTVFTRATSSHGTSRSGLKRLAHVQTLLEAIIAADLASSETTDLIRSAAPQIVMHLGAEAYVPRSFSQPGQVFQVNANGTLFVLEALRRLPELECAVIASSSEVYGTNTSDQPMGEDHPLNPTSPYAASKAAADRLAHAYRVTYGLPIVLVRPFNTYGPRHIYDVIPKFIDMALRGDDLTIHGDGTQARDFTYVDDTVLAYLRAAIHPAARGEVINIGSGQAYSILDTAKRIVRLTGTCSKLVHIEQRQAEVPLLLCDNRRALEVLDWRPSVDFDTGLTRNIEWASAQRCHVANEWPSRHRESIL
jgi:nucleoside-diphosphate-sugar epimerase